MGGRFDYVVGADGARSDPPAAESAVSAAPVTPGTPLLLLLGHFDCVPTLAAGSVWT